MTDAIHIHIHTQLHGEDDSPVYFGDPLTMTIALNVNERERERERESVSTNRMNISR